MPENPIDPSLTWAALLARWVEFARSAVALPRDAEGKRWRDAVPHIIALQAVTHALAELGGLPPDERALGLDRAEILIRDHAKALADLWKGRPQHPELAALVHDAQSALAAAQAQSGDPSPEYPQEIGECCPPGRAQEPPARWVRFTLRDDQLTADHPGELATHLIAAGFTGDLHLPAPGRTLFAGCPVAYLRPSARDGIDPDDLAGAIADFLDARVHASAAAGPAQVYRQIDFRTGRATRDVVCPPGTDPPGGQALLVPVVLRGKLQPVSLPPAGWRDDGPVPVEHLSEPRR